MANLESIRHTLSPKYTPNQLRCAANVRDNQHCVGECGTDLDGIENKVDILGSTSSVPALNSNCLRCLDDTSSNQQFCPNFQNVYQCARCRQGVWNAARSPGTYVYTGDLFNEMTQQCCCVGGAPSPSSPSPPSSSSISTQTLVIGIIVVVFIFGGIVAFSSDDSNTAKQPPLDLE